MSLTIDLPPEAITRLNNRAAQEGRTPDELAAHLLQQCLLTDADPVDDWLRGPVAATLDKIDAGAGRFYSTTEAEQILAQWRTTSR